MSVRYNNMKTKTSFGPFADLWDEKSKNAGTVSEQPILKAMFESLGSARNKTMYEIACGNGFLARKFVQMGAAEVYASDVAAEMIQIATDKYDANKINYSTREATDFKTLPKNHFDAIVINHGIFYVKDINGLFKGARAVLKPNGAIIFNILHPLFPIFRFALGEKTVMGEPSDVIHQAELYLKNYTKLVTKTWETKNFSKQVHYQTYKRPLSFYTELLAKHGLLIESIKEPKSQTLKKGRTIKSAIPSSLIIKAIKV